MNFLSLKNNHFSNLILALFSALLFAAGWIGLPSFAVFFAFVPLLIIEKNSSIKWFLLYSILAIILWNLFTTLWIAKAAVIGIIAGTIKNIILITIPLLLYAYLRRHSTKALAYIVLITGVVAAEFLDLHGEISWPWLVLGNAFAPYYKYVQWYEYTGALGGSLWIMVLNALIFEIISLHRGSVRRYVVCAAVMIIPMIISFTIYYNFEKQLNSENSSKIKVSVLQPNIDPYTEKFGSMSFTQQIDVLDTLIKRSPSDVDFIVAPETAINDQFDQEYIDRDYTIADFKTLLNEHFPKADFISGTNTFILYRETPNRPTETARVHNKNSYYDISNSAVSINPTRNTDIYRKMKLVIGVEMLPYQFLFNKLGDFSVDLGGVSGSLMPQDEISVFTHTNSGVKVGTAICYESVYGEFFGGFVKKGAQVLFIITNDGWWDDTYGYKQHFDFARLRAIETRRFIARSANTGISGFFNPLGDNLEQLGWNQRGVIFAELPLRDSLTFYVKYGDYVGRLSSYLFILSLLYYVSLRYRKKLNSEKK